MLPFLALLGVSLAWFILPMLPALKELFRPSDVQPLRVVDRSSGDVAYFARNFQKYFDKQMTALPAFAAKSEGTVNLPDGTEFVRVSAAADALTGANEDKTQQRLVVVEQPVTLDGGETFLTEVYARAALTGGARAVYRAVYAEKELTLGEGSKVLRWVHAGGRFTAGAHSVLRGRVSSDSAVSLGGGVVFERIGAPVIAVGRESDPPPEPPASPVEYRLPADTRRVGDHFHVDGNLEIPEGVRFRASLVVSGTLKIGLGTIVEGSVKAHVDVELSDEAQVRGAVVARRRVLAGVGSWMGGPVIAEERIRLLRGAVVGGRKLPATVSAPEVELSGGATVYGQITAPMGGRTF